MVVKKLPFGDQFNPQSLGAEDPDKPNEHKQKVKALDVQACGVKSEIIELLKGSQIDHYTGVGDLTALEQLNDFALYASSSLIVHYTTQRRGCPPLPLHQRVGRQRLALPFRWQGIF